MDITGAQSDCYIPTARVKKPSQSWMVSTAYAGLVLVQQRSVHTNLIDLINAKGPWEYTSHYRLTSQSGRIQEYSWVEMRGVKGPRTGDAGGHFS